VIGAAQSGAEGRDVLCEKNEIGGVERGGKILNTLNKNTGLARECQWTKRPLPEISKAQNAELTQK